MGRIARNLLIVQVVAILLALLPGCSNVVLRDIVGYSILDPKISVEHAGAPVSSYYFGYLYNPNTVSVTFPIVNVGKGYLNLTGNPTVTISGADGGYFSVAQQPNQTSDIEPGEAVEFVIQFPVAFGKVVLDAVATIPSDDPDVGSWTIALTGTAC